MTAAKKILFSSEEYLNREEKASSKNEYFDGSIVAMAGSSLTHNLIAVNCSSAAWNALKNKNCRVFNSDQRVKSKSGHAFVYPDISIVCGTPELDSCGNLSNPKVIFEVLSDSTEKHDRSKKFDIYSQLESLEQYVLIHQDQPRLEIFTKRQNSLWSFSLITDLLQHVSLESLEVALPMSEIYQKVEFPTDLA